MNAKNYSLLPNPPEAGLNYDEIALQLREKGAPENLMQDIIEKLKALRLIQKRNTGFTAVPLAWSY